MSYLPIRQIIEAAHQARARVRQRVEEREHKEPDAILAELLARLDFHDRRMQALMNGHGASADPMVLNTWVQYTGTEELQTELDGLLGDRHGDAPLSTADALDLASLIDQRVIDLFELARAQAPTPKVESFFDDLLTMERQHAMFKSRNQVEAEDLRSVPGDGREG